MAAVGIDFSQPRPFELERTPSQPSLSHTVTTEHSDDPSRQIGLMTPHLSHRDLAGIVTGIDEYSSPLQTFRADDHVTAGKEEHLLPPQPSFTDRRSKRLSLSRSLQSLRDKAMSEKARRRASSLSAKQPAPPPVLPPVPSIPSMYMPSFDPPRSPGVPTPMRKASASTPQMPSRQPAPPPSQAKQSGGFGALIRKLKGKKSKNFTPSSAEPARYGHAASSQQVPVVEPPKSVRGVLAELDASSAAIQRRATIRRSALPPATTRRVPVPSMLPDGPDADSGLNARDSAALSALPDPVGAAKTAADARANALAALEGARPTRVPSQRSVRPEAISRDPFLAVPCAPASAPVHTPAPAPAPSSHSGAPLMPVTPPDEMHELPVYQHGASLASSDSNTLTTDEPEIKVKTLPPPILTQTVVMEPDQLPDSRSGHAQSPNRRVQISTVRSVSSPVPSSPLYAKRKQLSDFGDYDSGTDDGSDGISPSGASGSRSLQLRLPQRRTSDTFGPCSPYSMSSGGHGMLESPTDSAFEHGSNLGSHLGHGGSSVGHSEYHSAMSHKGWANSSAGHGSNLTHSTQWHDPSSGPTTPRTPRDPRFAGSSPAHEAPIGDGLSSDGHGRNNARMRLASGSLRRNLSRKPKQPPTSYDAYEAKQKEMLTRRKSCKPTIHSQASIAAEMREVANKEDVRVMEACFMS